MLELDAAGRRLRAAIGFALVPPTGATAVADANAFDALLARRNVTPGWVRHDEVRRARELVHDLDAGEHGARAAGELDTTLLGAFVKYLKSCESVDEVKTRCTSLMAIR